jgi:hypothetical protein
MDCHEICAKTLLRFNFCATQCYSATLECMPVLPEFAAAVSFLQLDLSLALSCFLNKKSSAPLLFSQQDCCFFLLLLASHQKASWPLTKISFTPFFLALGISPRTSWNLTKSLLLSQQYCFHFFLLLEWVRPLALINLMREGEEFSNLTAEIRLDGWLRFGVSSLTLTSIMKLYFNFHLTN